MSATKGPCDADDSWGADTVQKPDADGIKPTMHPSTAGLGGFLGALDDPWQIRYDNSGAVPAQPTFQTLTFTDEELRCQLSSFSAARSPMLSRILRVILLPGL